MSSKHSSSLPVLSLLLGATLWGIIWYPLRLLDEQGLPGLWASLVMYLAVLLISFPLLWRQRAQLFRHPWLLLGLALVTGWCNVAFVLAVIEGNIVRVLLLFYLSPIWAALLGWIFLGERLSWQAWATFGIAMGGAVIMLWQPDGIIGGAGNALEFTRADWLAISSGLGFALSNVLVRKLQDTSVPVKTVVVWCGAAFLAGVWILLSPQGIPELELAPVAGAIALGWFGIALMTLAVQYGVTHMPVHRSAVILLFELVAGAISSQLLSDEVLQTRDWLGGLLIIAAAYLSANMEQDKP